MVRVLQRGVEIDFGLGARLDEQLAVGVAESPIARMCQQCGPGWLALAELIDDLLAGNRVVVLDEFGIVRYCFLRRHLEMKSSAGR